MRIVDRIGRFRQQVTAVRSHTVIPPKRQSQVLHHAVQDNAARIFVIAGDLFGGRGRFGRTPLAGPSR